MAVSACGDSGCDLKLGKDGVSWWWRESSKKDGKEMENKCKGKKYKRKKSF